MPISARSIARSTFVHAALPRGTRSSTDSSATLPRSAPAKDRQFDCGSPADGADVPRPYRPCGHGSQDKPQRRYGMKRVIFAAIVALIVLGSVGVAGLAS